MNYGNTRLGEYANLGIQAIDCIFGSLDDYLQAKAKGYEEANTKRLFTNYLGKVRKNLGGYGSGHYSSEQVALLLDLIDIILQRTTLWSNSLEAHPNCLLLSTLLRYPLSSRKLCMQKKN